MDILYGKNPVLEALRAGRPARKVVVATGVRDEARLREILDRAAAAGVPVEETARRRLDDITHTEHHQGVAGYFHARPSLRLDELLAQARAPALFLVLDGIQDPHNLGALARTADAAGVDGIVLARDRATAVTPAAVKASAGALEHVAVCTVPNLAAALAQLGDARMWRVGLDAEASTRYDAFDYTSPTALVVGAEGEGLRTLTRKRCDALVRLPMMGRVESLNAAVAGGLLMYEAARQRGFTER
ncbi:MAG TPA: 23S rRNA (guanosine(2251)-2'-O)-methyltransferase RlmB [Candidatus Dormibacteraeota bacterium]|nr:23S rRNA (guanosine(2251)-2'-O)-methyltransferase RlmB [Candidatus Dormibacteraeota bacterium]